MWKRTIITISVASIVSIVQAQPQFELSTNVYRLPYGNGITVDVHHDVFSHDPVGRYDLKGTGNGGDCSTNYPIVAAAEGIVRRIVDNHSTHGPDCSDNCTDYNNYIWIEHANGEWSKYTHLSYHSISVTAGLSVGDQVCAGTFLGYECDIGQASGPHLHFELRRPNDPLNIQISVSGGFMEDAAHLVPVFNSFAKHFLQDGDSFDASGSNSCTNTDILLVLPTSTGNNGSRIYMASNTIVQTAATVIVFGNGANGLFHAGGSVTLAPGFTAASGSSFVARIGNCATTNLPGGCN